MTTNLPTYNRHAVQPIECLKAGWALTKDRYWLFAGITTVGILIASMVPMGILMGPMMCGMYLVLFRHMRRQPIEFGMLFKGFDYFVESLVATVLQFVPIIVLLIPVYVAFFAGMMAFLRRHRNAGGNPPSPEEIMAMVSSSLVLAGIVMLVMIVVGILFSFTYPLIVDRKLSAIQAIKLSIKAGLANFWGLLGLLLLNGVIGIGGVACCYIGAFLVMPITFGGLATAYRQVFELEGETAGSQPNPSSAAPAII